MDTYLSILQIVLALVAPILTALGVRVQQWPPSLYNRKLHYSLVGSGSLAIAIALVMHWVECIEKRDLVFGIFGTFGLCMWFFGTVYAHGKSVIR
jgi:hypothetical protein